MKTLKNENLRDFFLRRVKTTICKELNECSNFDLYTALAYAVRDLSTENWIETQKKIQKGNTKRVYYISLEFLMGRTLGNALINTGLYDSADSFLKDLGSDLSSLLEEERDAGLGNGGLGRLAACFLDSIASLDLPGYGSGIRYDYGIFEQKIEDGYQVEEPDNWLRNGNAWEVCRPGRARRIKFFGNTQTFKDNQGRVHHTWNDTEDVIALPFDTPIPGYDTTTVNTLRLWSAKSVFGFNLSDFNRGDYIAANIAKSNSENISKVLYPNDNNYEGKELRLKQQYFLCAATLQDILEDFKEANDDIRELPNKIAIQLNDTHPTLAIPELMRILLDEEGLKWDESWDICKKTFAYTNHTLLSEALEKWPVDLMKNLLPRHMEIIYEINYHFLREVANRFPQSNERLVAMSLIEEGHNKQVRMAYLAIIGSHSVNGVAALHTELLKHGLVKDFYEFTPEKFNNKTNGITPRRWLKKCNPALSSLITSKISDTWTKDLDKLEGIEEFKKNASFVKKWQVIKKDNKQALIDYISARMPCDINPDSIFDIQIKRLHEYKRQYMNILHAIALYQDIKDNPKADFTPRTIIFAGKAAPGYYIAKMVIKLINAVASVINNDPDAKGKLTVLFLPNYSVSMAEVLIPAADLSEQISTAGKEASGTGNMKFALNGALTIGTLDGANVEIEECVGSDNIYIFGLEVEEVEALQSSGYNPYSFLGEGSRLMRVLDLIQSGFFCPEDPDKFRALTDLILAHGDTYMIAADFDAYYETQQKVSEEYRDQKKWTEKAIINVANMGKFSSDRTIAQYAKEIWGVEALKN